MISLLLPSAQRLYVPTCAQSCQSQQRRHWRSSSHEAPIPHLLHCQSSKQANNADHAVFFIIIIIKSIRYLCNLIWGDKVVNLLKSNAKNNKKIAFFRLHSSHLHAMSFHLSVSVSVSCLVWLVAHGNWASIQTVWWAAAWWHINHTCTFNYKYTFILFVSKEFFVLCAVYKYP